MSSHPPFPGPGAPGQQPPFPGQGAPGQQQPFPGSGGPGQQPFFPGPWAPGGPAQQPPFPGPGVPGQQPPMTSPMAMTPPVPSMPPVPLTPPPRSYPVLECAVPDMNALLRYAEAEAARPQIAALPTSSRPVAAYQLGYSQLPPDRFYMFKMWLQSAEGQHYTQWEDEARQLLEVLEPFNARWVQGWMKAEMTLLQPVREYLGIYDQYTQQLLTYSDLNPAARQAQLYGREDPANPLPFDVLAGRLPERSALQEMLASYDELWRDKMGIELATGWRTSWGAGGQDPLAIAAGIRQITDNVTSRLWSASELPELPAIPRYQPPVIGLPRSMTALQQQLCELTGADELPTHTTPEPFHPPALPSSMPPANPRWARAQFFTGRAVSCRNRAAWAEGVALEVTHGPTVRVQRYDGSVGWFPVNEVRGIR